MGSASRAEVSQSVKGASYGLAALSHSRTLSRWKVDSLKSSDIPARTELLQLGMEELEHLLECG